MKGIFKSSKSDYIICFICGLFCLGLFTFVEMAGNKLPGFIITFFIFLYSLHCYFFNRNAYLHIYSDFINGKYHYYNRINCPISNIDFVLPQINMLTIQLKDGKRITIGGLVNSFDVAFAIREKMTFNAEKEPRRLISDLNNLKNSRSKEIKCICIVSVLMFVNIFFTAFLTDGKELYEFNKTNWTIFIIMMTIEVLIVIVDFYLAQKAGKKILPIEKLKYTIHRSVIETDMLLPGNVLKVFTDMHYSGRITLFGYPDSDAVYYSIQELDADYNLKTEYTSDVYEEDELPYEFDKLNDITYLFK